MTVWTMWLTPRLTSCAPFEVISHTPERQQEIAERQRRVGRLRDEHHRQRQIDRERIGKRHHGAEHAELKDRDRG